MKVFFIFFAGLVVLVGAIILNFIASWFGLTTWYDFLKVPGKTSVISYIWLFGIYPFGLGVITYYFAKWLF